MPSPQRLLEATMQAIETGGEQSVNLRTIAEACGVTTPIIYKAYGSREGLLAAAQAERFRRAIDGIAAPFSDAVEGATTVDELRAVLMALADATHHPDRAAFRRVQIEVLGASISRPALRAAVDQTVQQLISRSAAALGAAQARGLVRPDVSPTEVLWWYFGQVQGRLLLEQTTAPVDAAAWNRASLIATLAVVLPEG